jgi:hypothetical protein
VLDGCFTSNKVQTRLMEELSGATGMLYPRTGLACKVSTHCDEGQMKESENRGSSTVVAN